MPKVEANTKTFEDVLDALERQNLQVNTPDAGTKFLFADTVVEILAPIQYHEDLNNNSIVLRVIYEDNTFLFTGDMEEPEEFDVINSGYKLYADLLKIGHHGSDTSTSQAFLDKVNPQYAIISVGTGNSYGHPTEATLERLNGQVTAIYRTDLNGNIHVTSDGNIILVENTRNYNSETTQKSEDIVESQSQDIVESQSQEFNYIGNKNSKKFHLSTCYTLPSEKNRVQLDTREEALELGFQPCKNCNP